MIKQIKNTFYRKKQDNCPHIRRSQALLALTPYLTMAGIPHNQLISHSGTLPHHGISAHTTRQPGNAAPFGNPEQKHATQASPYRTALAQAGRHIHTGWKIVGRWIYSLCKLMLLLSLFLYLFGWPAALVSRYYGSIESFIYSIAQEFPRISQLMTLSASYAPRTPHVQAYPHHKGIGGQGNGSTLYI